mgnify:FL=1
MTRARLSILLLLTFLVGLGAGMLAGGRIWHARWRYWRAQAKDIVLQKMDRELVLTADQRRKIEAILTRRRNDIRALRGEFRAKVSAIRDRSMAEIRPLLTPAQRPGFETIMADYDARWRKFRGDTDAVVVSTAPAVGQ